MTAGNISMTEGDFYFLLWVANFSWSTAVYWTTLPSWEGYSMIQCKFCNGDAMIGRSEEPFLYNGIICCWKCFCAFFDLGFPDFQEMPQCVKKP